jgi:hypothetical protein
MAGKWQQSMTVKYEYNVTDMKNVTIGQKRYAFLLI